MEKLFILLNTGTPEQQLNSFLLVYGSMVFSIIILAYSLQKRVARNYTPRTPQPATQTKPQRTTTPTPADHATSKYAVAKWLAPILLLLFATFATNAQTYVGLAKSYGKKDTVKIYSDYGTDRYYFDSDSNKRYCTLSKWYSTAEIDSLKPYHFATNLQPIKPAIPTPTISVSPSIDTGIDTVVYFHNGNENPEFCNSYISDINNRKLIVIDSFATTATSDYIALVAEIKAINKQIGYHAKVQNKAIKKMQKETFLAVLVYNNCKHRPTVAGYLGLYPIHLLAEHAKNLFWQITKLGKNQKIKELTATKKRLLSRKKLLNLQ